MDPMIIVVGLAALITLFLIGGFMLTLYKKVGVNQAMIITGGGTPPKIIVGGGTVVLPLLNQAQYLSLELMSIDIKHTHPFTTSDGAAIYLDAVVEARINGDDASIMCAAEKLGGKDQREIRGIVSDTIFDHCKKIMGELRNDQVMQSQGKLIERILAASNIELGRFGITCEAFRIKEIREVKDSLHINGNATFHAGAVHAQESPARLIGRLAIASSTISSDQEGRVTYELKNGTRQTNKARTRMIGAPINADSPVVITEVDDDVIFVEPWSVTYANLPESLNFELSRN